MSSSDPLAAFSAPAADEAVTPDGRVRDAYAPVASVLRRWGTTGLAAATAALTAERAAREVTVAA